MIGFSLVVAGIWIFFGLLEMHERKIYLLTQRFFEWLDK